MMLRMMGSSLRVGWSQCRYRESALWFPGSEMVGIDGGGTRLGSRGAAFDGLILCQWKWTSGFGGARKPN